MTKRLLTSFLLMSTLLTLQAQRISRKIVLNKGQKLESVVQSTTSMSQAMMGQQMDIKSNGTTTSLIEVKNATDKSFLISNTIKKMVITTSGMGQDMHFDSDKPEDMEGQIGAALKNKIGVAQDLVVNRQGKITEMKDTASAGDMLTGIMGSNYMVGLQLPIFTVLPDKPVKTGDTWTDSVGTAETIKTIYQYTLQKVAGNDAYVDLTGTLAKTGIMEQQGMQITMNLNGTIKGASVYDVSTGILKNNNTETKITGTIEVMGQSVPITGTTTTTTTVNKQ